MSRPNYYLLLELDCGEKSTAKIESAIIAKQAEWSRDRNHPKKGREAQQYLGLLTDIRKVMGNAEDREKESRECRELRQQAEKAAYADLDRHIGTVAARGHLFESEVAQLVQQFKGRFIEAEIRKRIKVPIRKDSRPEGASRPELDTSTAKEIENRLKIIAKKDLYDFLDLPQSTSHDQLLNRARELDSDARKNNNKSAEVTAQAELAGFCLRVFKSEEERERYDNTLAMRGLREMDGQIRIAGATGKIDASAMEALVNVAGDRGVTPDDARAHICAFASREGWAVELPPSGAGGRVQACGTCGVINAAEAEVCVACGEPLWIDCPQCRAYTASETVVCTRCGFKVGNIALVRRLVHDAQRAFADRDFEAAERSLREAGDLWKDCPNIAGLRDQISQQKRKTHEEERQAAEQIHRAIGESRFMAAERLLAESRQRGVVLTETTAWEKQIRMALDAAQRHVEYAHQRERTGSIDDAIDAYSEALRECQDFREAAEGLRKCPPDPPRNLNPVTEGETIRLTWQAGGSRGQIRYHVVRKAGSEPRTRDDGETVGETAATSLTDDKALAGQRYYYAVYAIRGDATSPQAAVQGPVLCTGEVARLLSEPDDGRIFLRWEPPSLATSIEVYRKEEAEPKCRGEGSRLTSVSSNSANDSSLANGKFYGYRVIAVFRGLDGNPVYSRGATIIAVPSKPADPVKDLAAVRKQTEVEAQWTAPDSGLVRVYLADRKPTHGYGDRCTLDELDSLGKPLENISSSLARGKLETRQAKYLVPVTISGSTALIGKAIAINWVDDVEELEVEVRDSRLSARWKWPPGIDTVLVAVRSDHFPEGPNDRLASQKRYLRFEYDRNGGYRMQVPRVQRLYLTVYAMLQSDGHWQHASGATPGSQKEVPIACCHEIRYRVNRFFFSRDYRLTIVPDIATIVPELVLVGKATGLPLHPKDGSEVLRIAAGTRCSPDSPVKVTFRPPAVNLRRWRVRLFAVDEGVGTWLRLNDES
ncbi:MAG: hypothetical protein WCJ35_07325 [Planctomycetota bacterium]